MKFLIAFLSMGFCSLLFAQDKFSKDNPALLPLPQELEWSGSTLSYQSFHLQAKPSIKVAALIANELKQYLPEEKQADSLPIKLTLGEHEAFTSLKDWQKKEAYVLSSTAVGGVSIIATHEAGLYRAAQTLQQLLTRTAQGYALAHAQITDWPDLKIRGLMNDVGRNYMPPALIIQEIDAMAKLKYNVYHFHLTENEGWRLESKIHPQINQGKYFTRMPGKYYSQKEFKQILEYCAARHITLIPELDMPGHTAALQRAIGVKKMEDPRVTQVLVDLIGELASLAPAEVMPYIHIGTDEAKGHERVSAQTLTQYYQAVEKAGRQAIRWQPGIAAPAGVQKPIQHLWTERILRYSHPSKGCEYIDSQETYINHLDPFGLAATFYFRRPCPYKWAKGIGFILCSWPDLPITDPKNQLLQSPIFSSLAFASEPLWNAIHPDYTGDIYKDPYYQYFTNLPPQGSEMLKKFAQYENRVLAIRDKFFSETPFPYVRQAHIPWKMIGPFPHEGKFETEFPPETELLAGKSATDSYDYKGQKYSWLPEIQSGHSIIIKHYAGYATPLNGGTGFKHKQHTWYALQYIHSDKEQIVPFWIGAQTWANSDRIGGPVNVTGEWHYTKARFYVNGKAIAAPKWTHNNPGREQALVDENYHFRAPTMVKLKKGWNQILIKSPSDKRMRRWMFTFAPILPKLSAREYPGLRFATHPKD